MADKLKRKIANGYEYPKKGGYKKLVEHIGGSVGTWTNIFKDPENAELKAWTEKRSVSHRIYENVDRACEDDEFVPDEDIPALIADAIAELTPC